MTDRSDKMKEAIKHALIALMEREPFEVISVKQIVAARSHFTTRIPFSVSNAVIEGSKSTFF